MSDANIEVKANAAVQENAKQEQIRKLELVPFVDILENSGKLTIWCEVPGACSETVNIEVNGKILNIEAGSTLKRHGQQIVFKRGFQISDAVDVENIQAKTKDGVLTLILPKKQQVVRKIKVS